ncbi:phage tail protein, partial [Clostridium tetani]
STKKRQVINKWYWFFNWEIETSIEQNLNKLFTFADNGKKNWVDVIGSPLLNTDSFSTLKSKTQTLKNTMASNLSSKKVSARGTESLSNLINKVKNIDTGLKYATGTYHIDTQANTPKIEVSNLSFKPKLIFASGRDYDGFPTFYIYSDGELNHSGLEDKWHVRSYYSGSKHEPIMSDDSRIYVYSNSFVLYTPKQKNVENVDMFWIAIGE